VENIKIGIIGIGNCASALIQGINYYRPKKSEEAIGLMNWKVGSYRPFDIEVVLAIDIDERKVGKNINEAIFQKPNCTKTFHSDLKKSNILVKMGKILDSFAEHMNNYDYDIAFRVSSEKEPSKEEMVNYIRESSVDVLLNYLPVGSEEATKFYAQCALEAKVAFINNIPVFIASDPQWAKKFTELKIPVIGDDIKSQLGATITHRVLTNLFKDRGVKIDRSYQINTGGNTDFLNMLDRGRLGSKKISKTFAVQSIAGLKNPDKDLHISPSDFVPWQKDNKVCFIRMEGRGFGDVPIELELRLSVEDSPNSAGVAIDMIRCCKLALDRNIGGVLVGPSAYFCKHPMEQFTDSVAKKMVLDFINCENIVMCNEA